MEQLFSGRAVDTAGMARRLKQVAEGLGLPIAASGTIYNTRLAQELAKWAELKGRANEIHQALFRAYFVEGRNIGNVPELVEMAVAVGLSGDEALEAMESRACKGAVDSDWDRSLALGIRAVPTFVMEGKLLVGFQTYEALEQFVVAAGVVRRDGNVS